jgi:uncharacterized membrane protein YbhN (UPF0104 family)
MIKKILSTFAYLAILLFLAVILLKNWDSIKDVQLQIFSIAALFGIIGAFLYTTALALLWSRTTKSLGIGTSYIQDSAVWGLCMVGKYIPGKIWLYAGRAVYYKKLGRPVHIVGIAMILETILCLLGACVFFFVSGFISLLNLDDSSAIIGKLSVGVTLVLLLCAVLSHPALINWTIRIANKILKKDLTQVSISYRTLLLSLLGYIFNWGIFSAFLFPFFISLGWTTPQIIYGCGCIALSGVIGMLALFAPAGLGVREGVLVMLLAPVAPIGVTVAISLLIRLWLSVAEVLYIFLCLLIHKLILHGGGCPNTPKQDTLC